MRHDRTRLPQAKARTLSRRSQRRAKSFILFSAWAFGPELSEG